MRNIYLDIDGVLNRAASPQADIVAFLTYLLDRYPKIPSTNSQNPQSPEL